MIMPVAGRLIKFLWASVIRGGRNPFVVEFTSSMALASGKDPFALIPTFCACAIAKKKHVIITSAMIFFISIEY